MAILGTLYLRRATGTAAADVGLEYPRRDWAGLQGRLEVLRLGSAGRRPRLPPSGSLCTRADYRPGAGAVLSQWPFAFPQEAVPGPGTPGWVSQLLCGLPPLSPVAWREVPVPLPEGAGLHQLLESPRGTC